jgi:hypothetical protein
VLVDQDEIHGTYVMAGTDFSDELRLKDDGTVVRTRTQGRGRWTQTGRWTAHTLQAPGSVPNTVVEFDRLDPSKCPAGIVGAGATSVVPDTPLCGGSNVAFFCFQGWRLSLCFDEDISYRFRRKGWLF